MAKNASLGKWRDSSFDWNNLCANSELEISTISTFHKSDKRIVSARIKFSKIGTEMFNHCGSQSRSNKTVSALQEPVRVFALLKS